MPLVYIIRENDITVPGTVYVNDLECHIANALLTGTTFTLDNHWVHRILMSLVLKRPGYVFISQHDNTWDRHGAWKSLLSHYEG